MTQWEEEGKERESRRETEQEGGRERGRESSSLTLLPRQHLDVATFARRFGNM